VVVGTHQLLRRAPASRQKTRLLWWMKNAFRCASRKKKIKALRKDVDVLTLSATPSAHST